MTKDCYGLAVNAMSFVHGTGPLFYASLPCESHVSENLKHLLISRLWDHLAKIESPIWKRFQSSGRDALPLQVVSGLLSRPYLLLGNYQGPAISFSEGGGDLWAAISGAESDIGIDVAGPDEFKRDYPFHRVFHPEELQHALRLTNVDLENASALLWSIKEAVVKALGSAFHLVDPRQITVYPSEEETTGGAASGPIFEDCGYTFSVGLSGKALERFPNSAGRIIWVRSLPQRKMWLSVALLNWQH